MYSNRLSQQLALVATIDPQSVGVGTSDSDAVDMATFRRCAFVVLTGVLGASATVDFKLRWSATSGGTYADITGKAITQLVKASHDNSQAIVEITAEELLTADATARFVKGRITVGTAASIVGVVALADTARYVPASDFDLASNVQILA